MQSPFMTMNRDEMTSKMMEKVVEETGKTVDQWVKVVQSKKLVKHKQILNFLKDEHGLTYGYANTLAHVIREITEGKLNDDELLNAQYDGAKTDLKPIYDNIVKHVLRFGSDIEIAPKKSYVSFRRKKQFAIVQPTTKSRIDLGLILKGKETTERLEEAGSWNSMCSHRIRLTDNKDVDEELIDWLKQAYDAAG
jgi:predicted transport protein